MKTNELIIESERLRLLSVSEAVIDSIFSEFTDEITLYMAPRTPKERSETEAFVKRGMEKNLRGDDFVFAIYKKDGEFIGGGGVHGLNKLNAELGIWTKKSSHGNHFGREAVTAAAKWAAANTDVRGLLYPVEFANIASRKIAENLGGIIVGDSFDVNQSGRLCHWANYYIDAKTFRENL